MTDAQFSLDDDMGSGRNMHLELSVTDDRSSLDADDMGSGRGLYHELSVTDDRS